MKIVGLGLSSPPTSPAQSPALPAFKSTRGPPTARASRVSRVSDPLPPSNINSSNAKSLSPSPAPRILSEAGIRRASQMAHLFPSICPEVVVRDAQLEDCWEVAETHCSSFFPDYKFPVDLVLRIDRFVALLSGFSTPPGCMRTCLVAIAGPSVNENSSCFRGIGEKFSLNKGSVAGILTVDTLADFLPRKGPLRQRRSGIAYISNVAVRETERRKGIAKLLIAKAEARARSWGCRSIALHCDASNAAATRLYKGCGFKCIRIPENTNWPEPRTKPAVEFNFMMKLMTSTETA